MIQELLLNRNWIESIGKLKKRERKVYFTLQTDKISDRPTNKIKL